MQSDLDHSRSPIDVVGGMEHDGLAIGHRIKVWEISHNHITVRFMVATLYSFFFFFFFFL